MDQHWLEDDVNVMSYDLAESLDSLFVTFSGASALKTAIGLASPTNAATSPLTKDSTFVLDFTALGTSGSTADSAIVRLSGSDTGVGLKGVAAADSILKTGLHTIAKAKTWQVTWALS